MDFRKGKKTKQNVSRVTQKRKHNSSKGTEIWNLFLKISLAWQHFGKNVPGTAARHQTGNHGERGSGAPFRFPSHTCQLRLFPSHSRTHTHSSACKWAQLDMLSHKGPVLHTSSCNGPIYRHRLGAGCRNIHSWLPGSPELRPGAPPPTGFSANGTWAVPVSTGCWGIQQDLIYTVTKPAFCGRQLSKQCLVY